MPQRGDRDVVLLLASGKTLPLTRQNLLFAFNSRQFHILCLGLAAISLVAQTLFSESFDLVNLTFNLLVLPPISLLLTFVIYFGSIEAVLTLAKSPKVLIQEPIISLLVALLMVPFQIGLSQLAGVKPLMGNQLTLNNFFFYFVGMQVTVLSYGHLIFGRRAEEQMAEDSVPQSSVKVVLPPRQLVLGDIRIAQDDLEMLEARDHYVAIIGSGEENETRARLKDLTDSLSDIPGRMVHRSAWVREASVASAKRQRDGLWLTLRSGRKVKVARPRQPEVEVWLRSVGLL